MAKKRQSKMWDNLDDWSNDPKKNPLLLGWYSLDGVLAAMIAPALKKMRENLHGHPVSSEIFEYAGMSDDEGMSDKHSDDLHAAWEEIVEKIHDSFLIARWQHECEPVVGCYRLEDGTDDDTLLEARREGMALFAQFYDHLWD